jgi:hypothetical protein
MAGYTQTGSSDFRKLYTLEHPPVVFSLTMITGVGPSDGEIDAGTLVGKITSSGNVRPLSRATLASTPSAEATLTLSSSSMFKVGDSVKIDDSGSALAVTAVDKTNNTITVTPAASGSYGEKVEAQDGSATAYAVTLQNVDISSANNGVPCLIHGIAYQDYMQNLDSEARTELYGRIWFRAAL